jgi:hypothetical protein
MFAIFGGLLGAALGSLLAYSCVVGLREKEFTTMDDSREGGEIVRKKEKPLRYWLGIIVGIATAIYFFVLAIERLRQAFRS